MSEAPAKRSDSVPTADLTAVPRTHYGRWLGALAVVAFLCWLAYSLAHAAIDWGVVRHYLTMGVLLKGLLLTLVLTVVGMVLGVALGVVVAMMRLSRNPVTSGVGWLYVWVFRGTPVYLQLLAWFNIGLLFPYIWLPGLGGARTVDLVTPFVAAAIGLGLNQGAYTSEVVRAGILSIDEGQTEAAQALGMSRLRTMRKIVLPQAMRVILPPIGNETIGMLKTTSLASAIGVSEILSEAQHIYFVNNRIMELLIVCAIWYLAAVSVLSVVQYYLERHFAKGSSSRSLPDTPLQRLRKVINQKKAVS
ncbi:amino acid ABC transporter permease [Streptomyces iranensis]|uniref:Permease n=1 Tax=Streptomyces iranensis TaxID=576784 RepID=A0A061A198_9ACTN|nr:amino acid ABC transporter permease [Streptomyces iranensis]MBP2068210.1 polar amino acid transport system permease protein [Streptomyces iranensis]CDR09149.1 permease [Streptomyces iranensis]